MQVFVILAIIGTEKLNVTVFDGLTDEQKFELLYRTLP